ncbi:amidohydrolase [Peptoniphilus equinus]|uniref:Amidohydrolase n=1 Tax=Peptoniphilus equinus TaxID=3016343 RepID=A0ABY7QSC5_9FIRM|nr:amidohydrolase [Peptoniphilus equinus]WBW49647.1 amidohydrolase [Peptoniphilus equinus]
MDITNALNNVEDYVIAMRRHFHMHPERSFEEFETTKRITEELDSMGVSYELPEEAPRTGVIAYIDGTKEGAYKAIALRADIDALSVTEANNVEYKSQNAGTMHACGHDGHAAMLLGAAKVLAQMTDQFCGRVYLIFQPAEEVGLGAKYMMRQGTWFDEIDSIYGSHLWNSLEAGKINVEAGPRMASAETLEVAIHGKSGHSSEPHTCVNAVLVAAQAIVALQQMASVTYNAFDPVVIVPTMMEGGTKINILPGEAKFSGTARYFSKAISERIEDDVHRVLKGVCDISGATYDLTYTRLLIPTINDPGAVATAHAALTHYIGEEVFEPMAQVNGGEDFSFYLDKKPGVFAFVGTRNVEKGCAAAHHNERFDIDESALKHGVGMYVGYTLEALQ